MAETWRDRLARPGRGSGASFITPPGVHTKLDAAENPYRLPPQVAAGLAARLAEVHLNRYPDDGARELKQVWARQLGVASEQLVIGNGSCELIAMAIQAFSRPRIACATPRIVVPVPAFPLFAVLGLAAGAEVVEIPLGPEHELSPDALARQLRITQPNLVFLDRPNNPTGALWDRALIERAAASDPACLVVVDEVYADYAGDSVIDLVADHANLIVLRSLSKLGLATLRIAAVVAHPELAAELDRARLPFNVNGYSQVAAAYLLANHADLLAANVAALVAEREWLAAQLRRRRELHVFASHCNSLLVRLAQAGAVWQSLLGRGVLVKRFAEPPALRDCLRISVGLRDDNLRLLAALDAALASHQPIAHAATP